MAIHVETKIRSGGLAPPAVGLHGAQGIKRRQGIEFRALRQGRVQPAREVSVMLLIVERDQMTAVGDEQTRQIIGRTLNLLRGLLQHHPVSFLQPER